MKLAVIIAALVFVPAALAFEKHEAVVENTLLRANAVNNADAKAQRCSKGYCCVSYKGSPCYRCDPCK